MSSPFSFTIESFYEGKLERMLENIKNVSNPQVKKTVENSFFDTLAKISSDYPNEEKAKRLVTKYNDKYEDYKLEQEIKSRESD